MFLLIRWLTRLWNQRRSASSETPQADRPASPAQRPHRPAGPPAASRGALGLLAHQARFDVLASLRNPRARFMTFLFPVLLLVVFTGVFGHGTTTIEGVHHVKLSRFYVAGILTMAVVVGSYATLVISVSALRESGVLKRRRATPASPIMLVIGTALSTVVTAAVMSTIMLVIAAVFYSVTFSLAALLAVAVTVIVGTLAFACLGYAVSGLIGSPDAAQPVVQMTMLPLWFISGVFIPNASLSHTVRTVGEVFPVEHIANSLHLASVHDTFASAISGTDILILAAWAAGAVALCAWRFSWLPSTAAA